MTIWRVQESTSVHFYPKLILHKFVLHLSLLLFSHTNLFLDQKGLNSIFMVDFELVALLPECGHLLHSSSFNSDLEPCMPTCVGTMPQGDPQPRVCLQRLDATGRQAPPPARTCFFPRAVRSAGPCHAAGALQEHCTNGDSHARTTGAELARMAQHLVGGPSMARHSPTTCDWDCGPGLSTAAYLLAARALAPGPYRP